MLYKSAVSCENVYSMYLWSTKAKIALRLHAQYDHRLQKPMDTVQYIDV